MNTTAWTMPAIKVLRAGYGYWETDQYPIGGSFRRAPEGGLNIVKILRTFTTYHAANEEGISEDGRRVAYCEGYCDPVYRPQSRPES